MNLENVLLRGTRASQPAANTVAEGSLYFVTDELLVEQSVASAWVAYSGITSPAGIALLAAALNAFTGSMTIAEALAIGENLEVEGQYYSPLHDTESTGATHDIDWNDSNEQYILLDANLTLTFSNPVSGGRYVLAINTGAGGFTVTFPANVRWPDEIPPVITVDANKIDLVSFIYVGVTSTYLGAFSQKYSL